MTKQQVTMTTVLVTMLGGPNDGWSGRITVPLEDEAAMRIRVEGTVFRVHRERGRMFLVHPTAVGLFWSE
jgi:hypothetical protein